MPVAPKTNRAAYVPPKAEYKPKTAEQAAARKFRSSGRWHKFRRMFVAGHPLCVDPLKLHTGQVRATQQVHHIVALVEDMSLALVESNCAGLCTECHSAIEQREQRGVDTRVLFQGRGEA